MFLQDLIRVYFRMRMQSFEAAEQYHGSADLLPVIWYRFNCAFHPTMLFDNITLLNWFAFFFSKMCSQFRS